MEKRKCPSCGADLSDTAPDSLCPRCLSEGVTIPHDPNSPFAQGDGIHGSIGRIGYQSGERIGKYKLLHAIGEGGMGTVWEAEELGAVRRIVALKVINP